MRAAARMMVLLTIPHQVYGTPREVYREPPLFRYMGMSDGSGVARARPLLVLPLWLAELLLTSATGLTTVIGFSLGASIQQNAFTLLVPIFDRA
jgi:hypothetical protein